MENAVGLDSKPLAVRGVIPSIITPFTADLRLDEASLRSYVRRFPQIPGITGLLCGAYTGEVNSLSHGEKLRIVEICQEETPDDIIIFACVDAHSTQEAIDSAIAARQAGADGVQVNSPFMNPLRRGFLQDDDTVVAFFQALNDDVQLPMVVFQYPEESGLTYSQQVLARLAEIDYVVGFKENVSIDGYLDDYKTLHGKASLIADNNFYGFLAMLLRGADATMIGLSNVGTDLFADVFRSVQQRDYARAIDLTNAKLIPLMDAFVHDLGRTRWSFVARVKEALVMQGLIAHGAVRPPEPSVQEGDRAIIKQALQQAGLL